MNLAANLGRTAYLDDVDIREYGWHYEMNNSSPLLVDGSHYTTRIPGKAGQLHYGDDPAPIPFNLRIFTVQKDAFDLQIQARKLKRIFYDEFGRKRYVKLRYAYEPDRYYNVRLNGDVDLERIFAIAGSVDIPLISDEGYAESIVSSEEVLWGSEEITFASTAYTYGHLAGGLSSTFTSAGTTQVEVVGDAVRPVIRVDGSGTNVTITLGGHTLNLGTFTNAEWIIDLIEYVILKNGVRNMISGNWVLMYLVPGTNTITVGGTGLNLEVTFEFKDIWYG